MPLLGVIFDFDGVLADTEPLHLRAYQDVLADSPMSLDRAAYYDRYLGFDDMGVFTAAAADSGVSLSPNDLEGLIASKGQRFLELLGTEDVLFPGARACVERLSADLALGVASGALHDEIDLILTRADLRRRFTCIVATDDVERPKPAPDSYTRAIELLSADLGRRVSPSSFVAVEDSRWGIEAAAAAGLPCLGVTHTYPAEELGLATRVLPDLSAIDRALLEGLC